MLFAQILTSYVSDSKDLDFLLSEDNDPGFIDPYFMKLNVALRSNLLFWRLFLVLPEGPHIDNLGFLFIYFNMGELF